MDARLKARHDSLFVVGSMVIMPDRLFIQATCVAIDGMGVLLRGPSGSGKSDLALRLIDGGARLVADDGVDLRRQGERLFASLPPGAPESVRGHIELRGLGILPAPAVAEAPLDLVIDLVAVDALERLPEPLTIELLGVALPLLRLFAREPSAAAKVRLAVRAGPRSIIPPP
jgi:serine kinase of HPr protein (carbohydrate metabolism regulator)